MPARGISHNTGMAVAHKIWGRGGAGRYSGLSGWGGGGGGIGEGCGSNSFSAVQAVILQYRWCTTQGACTAGPRVVIFVAGTQTVQEVQCTQYA